MHIANSDGANLIVVASHPSPSLHNGVHIEDYYAVWKWNVLRIHARCIIRSRKALSADHGGKNTLGRNMRSSRGKSRASISGRYRARGGFSRNPNESQITQEKDTYSYRGTLGQRITRLTGVIERVSNCRETRFVLVFGFSWQKIRFVSREILKRRRESETIGATMTRPIASASEGCQVEIVSCLRGRMSRSPYIKQKRRRPHFSL